MESFYVQGQPGTFLSQPSTAGPWSPESQHGGPPAALLARAVEQMDREHDRVLGRFTMELLRPVPVGPLSVTASVVRPGRSVELCQATLYDASGGRPVATASAWLFPARTDGPSQHDDVPPHAPESGHPVGRPDGWFGGYLDAVEWKWVRGAFGDPGPATVWMRPLVGLVAGEPMTPTQQLMTCVDSASGASAALDPRTWAFLNTELTVHLLRPPEGEWLCLDARTDLGPGSVGLATSAVYDVRGLVARSAQALLVTTR